MHSRGERALSAGWLTPGGVHRRVAEVTAEIDAHDAEFGLGGRTGPGQRRMPG
ncbi:hypothetical protein [Microbacterium sp. AISO3]|uniref:hypothetical protein n=1 Tax=Microbacterium sp. AISO3 TaxID=2002831 RepID=UPI001556BCCE|nr:hypothetical protein [Microbacterium sp. AISO3]